MAPMNSEGAFDWESRITIDPNVMGGKPVLKGRRIPVETIVGALAGGTSMERVCSAFRITQEDIQAALSYAAQMLRLERVYALPRR
jgi:uncharacterized protein (DUF433 family)